MTKDYYYQLPLEDNISVRAYDCYDVASWNPTSITWNNQPYSKSNNGYRSGHSYLSSVSATSSKTTYSFSITDAVKRWLSGGVNNGIMLASSDESSKTQIDFHSSRASSSGNYPQLYITYTAPTLSESTWETDRQNNEKSFGINVESDWIAYTSADWLTLGATSGTPVNGYSTNKIIVAENTAVGVRTGTVTVKSGNTVIGTITVNQYGIDAYLTLNSSGLNFDAGNSKRTVNIESNTVWSFDGLPDWITATPSTGSGNATVEIDTTANNCTSARTCTISITADTVTKNLGISQACDTIAPVKPDIFEEYGSVCISSRSFNFNKETESPEYLEYKIGMDGTWTTYNEPLDIVNTYDVTVYARVHDEAGNISGVSSLIVKSTLGEYTTSFTDISFGEGLFPVNFDRTYTSTNGWFFSFEASIQPFTNGYIFTDFYGNKQYFIEDGNEKYLSIYGDELIVKEDQSNNVIGFELIYDDLICNFDTYGKLSSVRNENKTFLYVWDQNKLTIDNCAVINFINEKPTKITVTKTESDGTSCIKEVCYEWTDDNLTKFTDTANIGHNYAYNTNGLLTQNETDTIDYSNNGRVKKISQANGAFVKYTYNDIAVSADEKTPSNIGSVTVLDSKGVTDTVYYSDGFSASNSYDYYSENSIYAPENISNEITTTDIMESIAYAVAFDETYETHDYFDVGINTDSDAEGTESNIIEENPLYSENEDGSYTFYRYNERGNIIELLEVKSGVLTVSESTTYDDALEVADKKESYTYSGDIQTSRTLSQRLYGALRQVYSEEYTYDTCGLLTHEAKSKTSYDLDEQINSVTDTTVLNTTDYEYDCWNQCVKTIEDAGTENEKVKTTTYDVLSRVTHINDGVNDVDYVYNASGNLSSIMVNGEETKYYYNNAGDVLYRHDPNDLWAYYDYDDFGNLTSHTYNGYSIDYNTLGSVTRMYARRIEDSLDRYQRVHYTYSKNIKQNPSTSSFTNGQNLAYVYDEEDRITEVKLNGSTVFTYSYDENGVATIVDSNNNTVKIVEENKTTFKEDNVIIYKVENSENEIGNTVKTNSIGNVDYNLTVNENEDVFSTGETSDFVKTFEYDDFNENFVSKTTIGGVYTSGYDYNLGGMVTSVTNHLNNSEKTYSYEYTDGGKIKSEYLSSTLQGAAQSLDKTEYTYSNGQLTAAENSSTKWLYTYDDRGNITLSKEYSVAIDDSGEKVYTLIDENTYTYSTGWLDELMSYNSEQFAYDDSGNPTLYRGTAMSWTMGRQLASYGSNSYTYNEEGIRTSKTVGGVKTSYYLDGTNIIYQTNGTDSLYFFYDRNSELVGFKHSGNNYYYVKNLQGDITDIADSNGNIIASYTYDPWGKVLSVTGTNIAIGNLNPFRYRSYYYDIDSSLYYLQSRYYDPDIGRFINCDDINYIGIRDTVVSFNPFVYCENDPVNYIDPTGTFSILAIITTFAAIIALFTGCSKDPEPTKPEPSKPEQTKYEKMYKSISDKKISSKDEFEKMSDVNVLARIIYAENSLHKDGQKAVALCIKNRKNKNSREFYSTTYGNTYKGVCLKSGAFEPARTIPDNLKNPSGEYWKHAKQLAAKLMVGEKITPPSGYKSQLFFVSKAWYNNNTRKSNGKLQYKMDGKWVNIKNSKNIGGNVFFDLV